MRGIGKKISGVEGCGESKVGLVLELREEIVNVLVRGAKSVEGENLENKTGWLEGSKKRQVSLFFVLESSEKSSNGVDGR